MSDVNKAIANRFYDEVVGQQQIGLIDEIISEDFVEHEEFPAIPPGREGVKAVFGMFFTAFPDLRLEVGDMVAEGDLVATGMSMTGTHQGEFMGVPETGKSINVSSMEFIRITEGKVTEHWGVTDQAGMMEQLGVMEGPGS